ncbi:MAG: hypothetical protein H6897_15050 [Rhodobacteraceae bacterium]|nr:hypothetical protein [Paracoccaceae bacterium]MCC0071231.1 hypothetical protein [Paracoccaceae bacterium]
MPILNRKANDLSCSRSGGFRRAVKRVADRAGTGEVRLLATGSDVVLQRLPAACVELAVLARKHRPGDLPEFGIGVVGEFDVVR